MRVFNQDRQSAYPSILWPLRALQAIAIGWIVLNQFREHLGLRLGEHYGLVFKGYLGAELFFVTAGFMACHAWTRPAPENRQRYGAVIWHRLARVWPLHVATLLAMAGLMLLGARSHAGFKPTVFDPAAIPANLALVQAWGVLPTVSWNFPSWLISAEWFAVLVFPATAAMAMKGWRSAWAAVLAPVALFAAAFYLAHARGVLFSDMTAQIGALQTIPAFLFGAGLYRFGLERGLSRKMAGRTVGLSAAWIVAAAVLRAPDPLIFPAFGALVLGLAETAKLDPSGVEGPLLSGPASRYLGGLSYALLLVYLPTDIAYFHAVRTLIGPPHGVGAWLALAGVFPAILLTAIAAHHLIERPAYRWLRRLNPFPEPAAIPRPA